MPRVKTSLAFRVAIGLIALAPPASFAALGLSVRPARSLPCPAAVNPGSLYWIGHDRILNADGRGHCVVIDLATSKTQPAAFGNPSPDGKWLLVDSELSTTGTLRRQPMAGVSSPPTTVRYSGITLAHVWLPDSSGWVTQRRDDARELTFERRQVAAPGVVERLPVVPWKGLSMPKLVAITEDGSLVLEGGDALRVRLNRIPPGATAVQTREIALDYRADERLVAAGTATGAVVTYRPWREPAGMAWMRTAWLRPAPPPRTEIRRIPLDGPPETLAVLDEAIGEVQEVTIAPDGKALLYWKTNDLRTEWSAFYVPLR